MKTIDEAKSYLENLPQLEKGTTRLCPRCGISPISALLSETALSRRADVYICPDCGTYEALEDYSKTPSLPLNRWACFMQKGLPIKCV